MNFAYFNMCFICCLIRLLKEDFWAFWIIEHLNIKIYSSPVTFHSMMEGESISIDLIILPSIANCYFYTNDTFNISFLIFYLFSIPISIWYPPHLSTFAYLLLTFYLLLNFVWMYLCVLINKCFPLSSFNVTAIYVFRADYFVMHNELKCSFQGKKKKIILHLSSLRGVYR